MTVTVRHVLFVLSLALCCACGCVAAVQQDQMPGISANELSDEPDAVSEETQEKATPVGEELLKAKSALDKVENEVKRAEKALQEATAARDETEKIISNGNQFWRANNSVNNAKYHYDRVISAKEKIQALVQKIETLKPQDTALAGAGDTAEQKRLGEAKKAAADAESLVKEAEYDANIGEKQARLAETEPEKARQALKEKERAKHARPPVTPQGDAAKGGTHATGADNKKQRSDGDESREALYGNGSEDAVAAGHDEALNAAAETSVPGGAGEGHANGQSAQGPAGGEGTPDTAAGSTHNAHTLVCAPLLLVVLATLACGAV
ncbi:hypothetical protein DQ04_16991000 [Trypanosoma grayi]|uniref:hypothetical protein n=1 Tax=Trypanosoma grayi TaxID=71804 RepID=UPI0004F41187|nr:hypothetical protein DQ04_16991000 [Trypanosoma grayi]KEG05960.1 hypothetical protein DQ04_16991000 [Trypanosoma grayi]